MTAKGPTEQNIRRAIKAARKEGLCVLMIRADGGVVVGDTPATVADVAPTVPKLDDDSKWDKLKL